MLDFLLSQNTEGTWGQVLPCIFRAEEAVLLLVKLYNGAASHKALKVFDLVSLKLSEVSLRVKPERLT